MTPIFERPPGGRNSFRQNRAVRLIVAILMTFAVASMTTACGRKGDLELPEGKKDDYPKKYPSE